MRNKQSLNGVWSYRVGHGAWSEVRVPFSRLPVGHSECRRTFDATEKADRTELVFEGITYAAEVTLNGTPLGTMLPYVEYRFDVTSLVRPTDNELLVALEDTAPAFGPTEGWENFGGIIRDVYLEYTGNTRIEDVFFHSTLQNDYRDATVTVETQASGSEEAYFEITLFDGETPVLTYRQAKGETLSKPLCGVRLWSPDEANLYRLEVTLTDGGETFDRYTCEVGFREITHDRHRFLVNGKPLFFKGVCKHEMVGDSGHCPTEAQIESDLRLIKSMGCNFVRLVHYPHQKKTLEIADRIGLMVSEEPGLWWSDTANPEVAGGSLEVLKRTILRDRNHPSIAFWLSFNECRFTEKYLIDSANVCRAYDPTRMVSGANCMSDEDTLIYYNKCGFDFYTMHPYSRSFDRAKTSAEILHDKPLLFTEWGGYHIYGNPHFLRDYMEQMNELYQANSDEGALAGAFLWYFAALNDFNRGTSKRREHFCEDGVLCESLVDKYRNPTLIYDMFCKCLKLFDGEPEKPPFFFEPGAAYEAPDAERCLTISGGGDFDALLARVKEEALAVPLSMRKRKLKSGPVTEGIDFLAEKPFVIAKDASVTLSGGKGNATLSLVGLTAFPGGYPLRGSVYGEELIKVEIFYADGTSDIRVLKNGEDITTTYGLNYSSRINPTAARAERFAIFGYDRNFDVYVMNRLELSLDPEKTLSSVTLTALGETPVLLYGAFWG